MASRRDGALAAALLVFAAVMLALLAPPAREDASPDPRLSSYRSSPHGARALALTLETLGIPVAERLTPYTDADSLAGPLALLAPLEPPTPGELAELGRWLEQGGVLFYVARPGDPTLDTLGLALAPPARDSAASHASAHPRPHRWTEGGRAVQGIGRVFDGASPALRDSSAEALLVTETGAVAALTFRRGRGVVVAWSDRAPLENQALRESEGALLFARAAAEATANGEPLRFDEYHQGYRGGGSPLRAALAFVRGKGRGWAALQLAGVMALVLLAAGWRFGSVIPPRPPLRRSPLEHVDALAALYREARARNTTRRLLLSALARRLGRRPPHDADAERRLIASLAAHPRASAEGARALEAAWARGPEGDLVALSRTIDRLLNEVIRT